MYINNVHVNNTSHNKYVLQSKSNDCTLILKMYGR